MTVSTSNKPAPKADTFIEDRETEIKEAVRVINEFVERANDAGKKADGFKMDAYWETGKRYAAITDGATQQQRLRIDARFKQDTRMSPSFFSLSKSVVSTFTDEQMQLARDNGMTVRVMAALVSIKDKTKRDELIQRAVDEGLNEDEIRVIKGTKGTRKKSQKKGATKKPPRRVFMKSLDQAMALDETIAEATEAINQLSEVKDKDKKDTFENLKKSRGKLEKLQKTIENFLKFSKGL